MWAGNDAHCALDASIRIPHWDGYSNSTLVETSCSGHHVSVSLESRYWQGISLTKSRWEENFADELWSTYESLLGTLLVVEHFFSFSTFNTPVGWVLYLEDSSLLESQVYLSNVLVTNLFALLLESFDDGLLPDRNGLILWENSG